MEVPIRLLPSIPFCNEAEDGRTKALRTVEQKVDI